MKGYNRTKILSDASRRQMINVLVVEITEINGYIFIKMLQLHTVLASMLIFCCHRTSPPRLVRVQYAKGIVELFLYLRDPFSDNECVSLYTTTSVKSYFSGVFISMSSLNENKKMHCMIRKFVNANLLYDFSH